MKQSIRFIYFDVGGVLLDWKQSIIKMSSKYEVTSKEIETIIEMHWDHVGRGGDTTAYSHDLATLFRLSEPYQEAVDFWTDHHIPIVETHQFAFELNKIYRLGLLTNAEPNSMSHARRKGLLPDISWGAIVDSSFHGAIKPEARIYEIAEKAAGVPPEEIFFIDDMPKNIAAAKSRGWQGMVFDTNNPIQSIKEIKDCLQG